MTITESTGIQRLKRQMTPMRYVFQQSSIVEEGHYTLMAIVAEKPLSAPAWRPRRACTGDLPAEHGRICRLALTTVKGVPYPDKEREA